MEVRQETDAVSQHIQKVAGFFSASWLAWPRDCPFRHYQWRKPVGKRACPLNSFYWAFIHRHRQSLVSNPRVAMMVRTWDRMQTRKRDDLLVQAERYRAALNEL